MRAERRATTVRFVTLLYLIEFLKTCHLLFTTPGSSGRVVPAVPIHPIFALGEQSTRAVVAVLLASLAAFGLGVTCASSALTCATLVLLQLADVTRCVCWLQIITGLFCAFALEDLSGKLFSLATCYPPGLMVAAQWTWAGLHKLNPSFLFGDMELIDPIVLMLTGRSELLVPSRCCGAVLETIAGSWLLYVFAVRTHSRLHRWVCVPCIFLSAMHVFLLIRLIQLDWARAAWGWNVWFSILALLFWDEVADGTQNSDKVTGRNRPCSQSSLVSSAKIGFILVYAVLPALTMFGLMPMFLGHAIYNANVVRTYRLTQDQCRRAPNAHHTPWLQDTFEVQVEASSEEALEYIFPRLAGVVQQPAGRYIPKPTQAETLGEFDMPINGHATHNCRNVTFVFDGITRWYAPQLRPACASVTPVSPGRYDELLVVVWPWFFGFEAIIKELLGRLDEPQGADRREAEPGSACLMARYTPPRRLQHGYSQEDRWLLRVCRSSAEPSHDAPLVWKRIPAQNTMVSRTFRCEPPHGPRQAPSSPPLQLPRPHPPQPVPPLPPLPPRVLNRQIAPNREPPSLVAPPALPSLAPSLQQASPPSSPPQLTGGVLAHVSWVGGGKQMWLFNLTAAYPEKRISVWPHGQFEIRSMRSSVRRTVLWFADELAPPGQGQASTGVAADRYIEVPCE